MPSERLTDLVVRPGRPEDTDAVAAMFSATRRAAVPSMPPPVHTVEEDRAWLAEQLAGEREAWIAEGDGRILGLLLLEGDWLHSLYVDRAHQGEGVGSVLLQLAQTLRPGGLRLWVFQSNTGARRFYARHGFVEVALTDGADNEEQAPDVRMEWAVEGVATVEQLRGRIDAVDDRLARLLEERALLTAQVQARKPVPGHAGRDAVREREIADRMGALAPHLGPARLASIMDAVIRASLDAAGHREER